MNVRRVPISCIFLSKNRIKYSKTCLKRPLQKKTKLGFHDLSSLNAGQKYFSCYHDRLSLNAGQKYCRMLQWENSAIISTFIMLYLSLRSFLFIFEWPLKTGFTVTKTILAASSCTHMGICVHIGTPLHVRMAL